MNTSRNTASAWLTILAMAAISGCGGGDGGGSTDAAVTKGLGGGGALTTAAVQNVPRAPVEPLGVVGVPDVNAMGLLDKTGPNAASWPKITNASQQNTLRQLGKALFWDMQVGGDGIQACASCHFNAGADHRIVNQVVAGGSTMQQLLAVNGTLTKVHYQSLGNGKPNSGLAVSEAALRAAGGTPDLADGTPGAAGNVGNANVDVKDIVGSQGTRKGAYQGLGVGRVDVAQVSPDARQGTGRNSPSVLNAVYNLRNFWDGRADAFFNGVNPLGFRDPDARVLAYTGGAVTPERLNIPFSSLASQAVGPIGSDVEMTLGARPLRDLGKKLTRAGALPLDGQQVAADDSLLAPLVATGGRSLTKPYADFIRNTFDQRFWGDGTGKDVCLDTAGAKVAANLAGTCDQYTLMQWNFPLFFGLAVQAYEATLRTDDTIVDLIAGGKATGTLVNGKLTVNTAGLALDGCMALLALSTKAADVAKATDMCTGHYAKFIHPSATSGAESATAQFPVPSAQPIGGCATPTSCAASPNAVHGKNTLLNVNLGLKRFSVGATACADCHFNPEFTGATVSTMTGFGAALPPLPAGQLRKEILRRAVMERMATFNGTPAVYDTGFYNIGVRPTPEDLSLGSAIGGAPLALSKLFEVNNGGQAGTLDTAKIRAIVSTTPGLMIPTAPNDLTPRAFPFAVGCGPNNLNANNQPINNCTATVIPGERLLRNGAFKAPGLRNVKFTGPYMHNGSKMSLRQVLEFYKSAGHMTALNFNNLDAGMKVFALTAAEESALIEMLETGLTDWRVAYQSGPFDHPELCLPNGQNAANGKTRVAALPAVGKGGAGLSIPTFEEMLAGGAGRTNNMKQACTVPGLAYDPALGQTAPAGEADLLLVDSFSFPL